MSKKKNRIGFQGKLLKTPAVAMNKVASRPTRTINKTHLSVCLFNQSMLDDFYEECQPFAKAAEFQVHYRGLVIRIKNEDSDFSVVIPTAMYNFKQEVSHAAVSWDGSDATARAELAVEASAVKVAQLLKDMPILNALAQAYGGTITEADCGTLHRHPGDFSFSGTDYDMDPKEPGVVFRKRNADDFLQNDSVMYFGNHSGNKIVCNETRVVNVKEQGEGVTGTYQEAQTYCFVKKNIAEKKDAMEVLIGTADGGKKKDVYDKFDSTVSFGVTINKYQMLTRIIEEYDACNYEPNIDLVEGKLIEGRTYGNIHYGSTVKWGYVDGKYQKLPVKESPHQGRFNNDFHEHYGFEQSWQDDFDSHDEFTVPTFVTEQDDEPMVEIIAGVEHIWDEELMMWMPQSDEADDTIHKPISEEEMIQQYLKDNNYAV